ncbi:hypothetical protein JQK62_25520, partial [Leptospira santarosai]|nr:hypothetical protein [Leptospira santarosai]
MPGGGQGGSGGTEPGGTMPEGGQDGSGGTTGSEPGIGDNVKSGFEFAKNAKKALITVPGDLGKVLDGSLSIYAGFKITDLKNGHAKSNR